MEFFCSRCGARLEAPGELASSRVRCGSCRGVTRTPDAVEGLPVATVAEPGPVILGDGPDPPVRPIGDDEALRHLLRPDEALVGRPILDYAATALSSRRGSAATEELAERLAQIVRAVRWSIAPTVTAGSRRTRASARSVAIRSTAREA
jgi:hypothetical protein